MQSKWKFLSLPDQKSLRLALTYYQSMLSLNERRRPWALKVQRGVVLTSTGCVALSGSGRSSRTDAKMLVTSASLMKRELFIIIITIETHRHIPPTLQYLFELCISLYTNIVTTRCPSYPNLYCHQNAFSLFKGCLIS